MIKRSKWCIKCLKVPLKALTRFRSLYIKGMNGCAGRIQYPTGAIGYPTFSVYNSRSTNFTMNSGRWSTRSGDEDLRELIRANSVGNGNGNGKKRMEGRVGRSPSVVVGRIDEDVEVEFSRDDEAGAVSNLLFPKRRSLATVSRRRSGRVFA